MLERFRRERDKQPADIYTGLRRQVLQISLPEVGITATPELPRVWGLLMDTTYERGGYSFVALADGTTSLYTTTGGGMIGGGEHDQVVAATLAALRVVEAHLDQLPPAADDTLPPVNGVVLRALTYDGQRAVAAAEQYMLTLNAETRLTCAQAVAALVKDTRGWQIRSTGDGCRGQRWYARTWDRDRLTAASPAGPPPSTLR